LYLEGSIVDYYGNHKENDIVPKSYKTNRFIRDGPRYHITLVHRSQIIELIEKNKDFKDLSENDAALEVLHLFGTHANIDDWIDLGIGRYQVKKMI